MAFLCCAGLPLGQRHRDSDETTATGTRQTATIATAADSAISAGVAGSGQYHERMRTRAELGELLGCRAGDRLNGQYSINRLSSRSRRSAPRYRAGGMVDDARIGLGTQQLAG